MASQPTPPDATPDALEALRLKAAAADAAPPAADARATTAAENADRAPATAVASVAEGSPPPGLARLRLYQLVSPALPVGAFSYAEGLEVLVQSGRLGDGAAVRAWLEAELQRGALRLEAAALPELQTLLAGWLQAAGRDQTAATVWRQRLLDRDGWLLAQREAPELRAQQRQMGGSLLQLLSDLGWPLPEPLNLAWPAAFAWAGHCLAVPATELVEVYLYGWVANQLSAAVRLVPLGPTEAQRLQLQLAPTIAEQAALLAGCDPDSLWSGGIGAGLAQLGQGELYSRLFRS